MREQEECRCAPESFPVRLCPLADYDAGKPVSLSWSQGCEDVKRSAAHAQKLAELQVIFAEGSNSTMRSSCLHPRNNGVNAGHNYAYQESVRRIHKSDIEVCRAQVSDLIAALQ